jgi:hypothetical protein
MNEDDSIMMINSQSTVNPTTDIEKRSVVAVLELPPSTANPLSAITTNH